MRLNGLEDAVAGPASDLTSAVPAAVPSDFQSPGPPGPAAPK